jgi:ribose transport system ATP-binding protein
MSGPRLRARGVKKSFGATVALAGVDLDVGAGEVHALLGENGAGKSTLVKILAGAERPDAGEMLLDGAPFSPRDPAAARLAGVGMVHQERALCPHLTVEENILLGSEPARFGVVHRGEARKRVQRALDAVDPSGAKREQIRPDVRVADLGPGERQIVEIARAIADERCRLLLLDEPTSSLGADDVEALFTVVDRLRAAGLSIVYISHHLDEIRRIADRFTVIRDGRAQGSGSVAEADPKDIVAMMAGRPVEDLYPRSKREPGEIVLEVRDLGGEILPVSASLELRRGEILGIAGLVGSGRTELFRAVFGLDPVRRGTVRVGAYVGPASPATRLAQGVGLLSEDRGGEGLALGLSIADNLTLSRLGPGFFVSPSARRGVAKHFIERLGVVARDPDQRVSTLSGGNQQKIALARLLHHDADVLLLDEPTRGVDVGSRAAIYRIIDELASERKKAVLVVSSSAEELVGVADRIAVMRKGRLGPARPVEELDVRRVMLEQAGMA